MRCRSSPTTRSPAFRQSSRPPWRPGRHATLARDHELKASRRGQLAGRRRSPHRPIHALVKDRHQEPRIHRIPQAPRRRLSEPYGDQADPRQSFGASPSRPGLGSPSSRPVNSNSPSPPSTARGSTSSRASSPSSPARCCAISASHPSRSSRTASWPPWITPIETSSSTLGLTSSTKPLRAVSQRNESPGIPKSA